MRPLLTLPKKTCKRCKQEKLASHFRRWKNETKTGLRDTCITCQLANGNWGGTIKGVPL